MWVFDSAPYDVCLPGYMSFSCIFINIFRPIPIPLQPIFIIISRAPFFLKGNLISPVHLLIQFSMKRSIKSVNNDASVSLFVNFITPGVMLIFVSEKQNACEFYDADLKSPVLWH